jgi:hypothetical protein
LFTGFDVDNEGNIQFSDYPSAGELVSPKFYPEAPAYDAEDIKDCKNLKLVKLPNTPKTPGVGTRTYDSKISNRVFFDSVSLF